MRPAHFPDNALEHGQIVRGVDGELQVTERPLAADIADPVSLRRRVKEAGYMLPVIGRQRLPRNIHERFARNYLDRTPFWKGTRMHIGHEIGAAAFEIPDPAVNYGGIHERAVSTQAHKCWHRL